DNEKRTKRLKRLDEKTNTEKMMPNNSPKFNLLKKINNNNNDNDNDNDNNNNRTLEELLESK
ncbi:hypothetical protein WUBG_16344, partial [Wuchereria bancrofti]